MVVFIASLFLPQTIHFNIPEEEQARPKLPVRAESYIGKQEERQPSLLPQVYSDPTPPETPAIATEDEEFFLSKPSASSLPKIAVPNGTAPIAPSDSHSPLWGQGSFFQPASRALSPPPVSILKPLARNESSQRRPRKTSSPTTKEQSRDSLKFGNWSVQPAEQGNGGLRNSVNAALASGSLSERIWVGTLGMPLDALEEEKRLQIEDKLENEFDCISVMCEDSDFDGHYSHYCKQILWPVLHYQIPDNPKSKAYEDHSWIYYVKINQEFADRIVKSWKTGDIIWIHDYHLLLAPLMLRKKLPNAQIGFFLHVAFPSSEVFRCLATRNELLEGVLGANLIGFQTSEYCRHFLQTCSRLLCVEATSDGVQLEDRFVNVETFPIGIDPTALDSQRAAPEVLEWIERMQNKYAGKHLIVAREKLDPIRGVRQKLLAYELFLNKYPQLKEKVVLIQVGTSTIHEAELNATVSNIVTRINSTHSSLAHQPIVFLKQDIEYPQYLAMITVADVLMNTSLREGMNLTSHEFIFCQDGKYSDRKHGPLILSEFTGSASIFGGNELSVNPWDYRQCAEAIKTALEMTTEERDERYSKLREAVMHHTGEHWFATFLQRLQEVWEEHGCRETISIPRLSVPRLLTQYKAASRRLFILDYEGTLAASDSATSIVFTSPQRTLDVLTDLLYDQKNVVYVMSGRKPEELDRLFRRLPAGLGLIAENGCFLKEAGTDEWREMADVEKMKPWKQSVGTILEYYKERTAGSWIEERHCSLLFHYEDAQDQPGAGRQAGECANHINEACESQRVHVVPVKGALVVESTDWNKKTAATHILEGMSKNVDAGDGSSPMPDFLMVAGNAREDEVIYRWANQLGKEKVIKNVTTVSVSARNTEAMATLSQGATGVLSALGRLASP